MKKIMIILMITSMFLIGCIDEPYSRPTCIKNGYLCQDKSDITYMDCLNEEWGQWFETKDEGTGISDNYIGTFEEMYDEYCL